MGVAETVTVSGLEFEGGAEEVVVWVVGMAASGSSVSGWARRAR